MSINSRNLKINKSLETDEQALERLRRSLLLDPRSLAFVPLSELCRKHGLYEEAIQVCVSGLAHHPGYGTGKLALARAYRAQGNSERARWAYEKALQLVKDNPFAHFEMGELYEELGELDLALRQLELAEALGLVLDGLSARIARIRAALASSAVALTFEASIDDEPMTDYQALSRAWLLRRRIEYLKRYQQRMVRLGQYGVT